MRARVCSSAVIKSKSRKLEFSFEASAGAQSPSRTFPRANWILRQHSLLLGREHTFQLMVSFDTEVGQLISALPFAGPTTRINQVRPE